MSFSGLAHTLRGISSQALTVASRGILPSRAGSDPISSAEEDITYGDVDKNGIPVFLSSEIRDARFLDVSQETFYHPDKWFTGYAADGYWYTNGMRDPTHIPAKATWATEAESNNRGPVLDFPSKVLVYATRLEVVLINAEDLTVWMRFVLNASSSSQGGTLLGDTTSYIHQADLKEGVLAIATSNGLRVADFRNDAGYWLSAAGLSRSSTWAEDATAGLSGRNTDGFVAYDTLANSPYALVQDLCYCVRLGTGIVLSGDNKTEKIFAAVGHPKGLSGVRLLYANQTYPEVQKNLFQRDYAEVWAALSDPVDAQVPTPYFQTFPPAAWGLEIAVGDTLSLSIGTEHTILEIRNDRLVVTPDLASYAFGYQFSIYRAVEAVEIEEDGDLYFSNGLQSLCHIADDSWYAGAGGLSGFSHPGETLALPYNEGAVHAIAFYDDNLLVATELGVYYATKELFTLGGNAEFRYSSSALVSPVASYRVLVGDIVPCRAVAVDPETGNVLVASSSDDSAVLTEIDPSTQRAFRHFDRSNPINALVAYRKTWS